MGYVEDAIMSSTRAVEFDRAGQLEVAGYYYKEAARLLELAYKHAPDSDDKPNWWTKAQEYKERAETLNQQREYSVHILYLCIFCINTYTYIDLQLRV